MNFDFFTQRVPEAISNGDEIALYPDSSDDFIQSGRYKVAGLETNDDGVLIATLIGMNHLTGVITVVDIGNGEPL